METEEVELEVNGRNFRFYITPAEEKNKPILFIFHGHGYNEKHSAFKSPNFNVVCPMDNYGLDGLGSWYLGENGDYFWLESIPKIIDHVRSKTGTGRIFMWGSSMGGYASILHGRLNNATAVYANLPQVRLFGTKYGDGWGNPYFKYVLGAHPPPELNDLTLLFKTRSRTQYFLCFNQLEGNDYLNEQCIPLINALHSVRNKFYLEVRPLQTHGLNHSISESIQLFHKYKD